jgi:hypothetical protein
MPNLLLTYNPLVARISLVIGLLLVVVAYLIYHRRRVRKAQQGHAAPGSAPPDSPIFAHSAGASSSLAGDVMRGVLILLAICVAAGLALVVVPESTIDSLAQTLRLRSGELPKAEQISLLYLGDETKGKEFHIRGAVRNISTQPIEKLDAVIRLYAPDGSLQETTVVRMDSEVIAPDATATFHLSYPDYSGQFGSYRVDFKLRQGEPMPFKDMRHPG